jgi:hypothetical protein
LRQPKRSSHKRQRPVVSLTLMICLAWGILSQYNSKQWLIINRTCMEWTLVSVNNNRIVILEDSLSKVIHLEAKDKIQTKMLVHHGRTWELFLNRKILLNSI